MLDGKYASSLNTPMGAINGTITLMSNGNNVQGVIEVMGMRNQFRGMKTKENECSFKGNFNTPMGNIDYTASCTVNGNMLELMANTNKGNFKIQGKRI
ncbi:MAG: hypothetical protein HFJ27_00280 [Clostridia bacterium]|nr:hypothetical protein [Clostridia bacterium]